MVVVNGRRGDVIIKLDCVHRVYFGALCFPECCLLFALHCLIYATIIKSCEDTFTQTHTHTLLLSLHTVLQKPPENCCPLWW
jgi:hypothetical protein